MRKNASTTPDVIYYEDSLVIRIPTTCPEAIHSLILRGLIASLRNSLLLADKEDQDIDGLVMLANMLQKVAPTEIQLQKAYEVKKSSAA